MYSTCTGACSRRRTRRPSISIATTNRPDSIETLLKLNDVELFDLQSDPFELNNLAIDRKKSGDLMVAMNAKLNKLIDAEVGEDVGQMLPGGIDGGWVATPAVLDM